MNHIRQRYNDIPALPPGEYIDEIARLYVPLEEYTSQIIPLMLVHAKHLMTVKNITAHDSLMQCGWLGRLITIDKRVLDIEKQNDIAGWPDVRNFLIRCLETGRDAGEFNDMIDDCMQVIGLSIEKRFIENYHFQERKFHCWWYTMHDDNSHLALHLVNAYQPDSPFNHLKHFLTTMLEAVTHAMLAYPGIKIVSCGSWLNQLPKFQQLWPDGFKKNQKILNETGGFGPGAWGQYMTTDGGFNHGKANVLRSTGIHPFALTEAICPVEEVIVYLKKNISESRD